MVGWRWLSIVYLVFAQANPVHAGKVSTLCERILIELKAAKSLIHSPSESAMAEKFGTGETEVRERLASTGARSGYVTAGAALAASFLTYGLLLIPLRERYGLHDQFFFATYSNLAMSAAGMFGMKHMVRAQGYQVKDDGAIGAAVGIGVLGLCFSGN